MAHARPHPTMEETCGTFSWQFYSRVPSGAPASPMPPTDAALVAIVHRTADASSMAGVPARTYGTSALPDLGPVPLAELIMSGARASGPVSGTEGRHLNYTAVWRGEPHRPQTATAFATSMGASQAGPRPLAFPQAIIRNEFLQAEPSTSLHKSHAQSFHGARNIYRPRGLVLRGASPRGPRNGTPQQNLGQHRHRPQD